MNIRLTWKIFIAFWASLWMATGIPMLFLIVFGHLPNPDQVREDRFAAASVLSTYGGRPAVEAATKGWSRADRATLDRKLATGRPTSKSIERPPTSIGAKYWGYAIHIVVGMACSLLLTLYLARPLVWLRDGFRQIAKGDLKTRLSPQAGRRRDEIADLARDFDSMAERLEELITGRERILHDLSHEIRSPLARLSVAIALARKNGKFSEEVLSRIDAEGTRVNELVENFLTLSRLESDVQVEERYFDIADLLRVVSKDAEFEARPNQVRVELDIADELQDSTGALIMCGAPELLRRALDNIMRNAIRFSPADRAVHVDARVVGTRLQVSVTDEGPGASEAMLKTMFDPFVKGRDATGGIGLGLAIAKRAVEVHNGTLTARNGTEGGLTVTLSLPYEGRRLPGDMPSTADTPDALAVVS